jgi:hypothetical protein
MPPVYTGAAAGTVSIQRHPTVEGAVIEGVKKLGTDPEIAKRLFQRINFEFDFGVRPHFFTPS